MSQPHFLNDLLLYLYQPVNIEEPVVDFRRKSLHCILLSLHSFSSAFPFSDGWRNIVGLSAFAPFLPSFLPLVQSETSSKRICTHAATHFFPISIPIPFRFPESRPTIPQPLLTDLSLGTRIGSCIFYTSSACGRALISTPGISGPDRSGPLLYSTLHAYPFQQPLLKYQHDTIRIRPYCLEATQQHSCTPSILHSVFTP